MEIRFTEQLSQNKLILVISGRPRRSPEEIFTQVIAYFVQHT